MSKPFLDQVLEDAIATLQRPGAWRQLACAFANGDPYNAKIDGDDTDGWCIHGAITRASRQIRVRNMSPEKLERDVMERIKSFMGWESDHQVHAFNDAENRTLDDVIGMLRRVLTNEPAVA